MPSISVIIPCFNQSLYLYDAIESVLRQNIGDVEIIVIDDGSTDAPPEFYLELECSDYLSLYRQANKGAAAARNLGISKATKEYIAFLDADDVWLPGKVKQQCAVIEQTNAEMVFTFIEQFISPELMNDALQNTAIKNKVMPGLCPSTMLIKREALIRAGLFNEQLKLGEFIAWYLKAKLHNIEQHLIEEIFVRRRIHKNNTSYRNQAHRTDYLNIMHQHLSNEILPV